MRSIASVRESEGQKMNLKQLIENYTRYCKVQGKTKSTLKWYERRLGRFLKFMEASGHSMLVKDVSMADGERHVMQLLGQSQKWAEHPFQKPTEGELSKYTVHGHVRAIRALTNWAYQQGYYPDDPFANLPVLGRSSDCGCANLRTRFAGLAEQPAADLEAGFELGGFGLAKPLGEFGQLHDGTIGDAAQV